MLLESTYIKTNKFIYLITNINLDKKIASGVRDRDGNFPYQSDCILQNLKTRVCKIFIFGSGLMKPDGFGFGFYWVRVGKINLGS